MLDFWESILLGRVVDGEFSGQFFAYLLIIIVRVLPHMEVVSIASFGQSSVVEFPGTSKCPQELVFGLFVGIQAILERLTHAS
jgi:hypothetical protein